MKGAVYNVLVLLVLVLRGRADTVFKPYVATIDYISTACQNVKVDPVNGFNSTIYVEGEGNMQRVKGSILIPNDVKFTSGGFKVFFKQGPTTNKTLFDRTTRMACRDIVLGYILQLSVPLNSECIAKKGTYPINLDTNTLFHKLIPKFYYGVFYTTLLWNSKHGNIYCITVANRMIAP